MFSELIPRKDAVLNFQEESNSYVWKAITKAWYKKYKVNIHFLQNKQTRKSAALLIFGLTTDLLTLAII